MQRSGARRALVAALCLAGCAVDIDGRDGFTGAEMVRLRGLSPLPALPPSTTNLYADDPRAASLGQMFFFDKRFSGAIRIGDDGQNGGLGAVGQTGKVACASCHMPESWFQDTRSKPASTSLAISRPSRNTPTAVNAAYLAWQQGGGAADSVWLGPLGPAEGFMASSRLLIAHAIYDHYKADYEAVFGPLDAALSSSAPDKARFPASGRPKTSPTSPDGAWEKMVTADQATVNRIFANFGKAIEAYERLLVSGNAPFDRYVAGDLTAISLAAKRGLKLFIGKASCVGCHDGPLFSDQKFHNLGVPQTGDNIPTTDEGRYSAVPRLLANVFNSVGPFSDDPHTGKLDGLVQDEAQKGQFRTKLLRHIAETGPYMHTGQYATLEAVVDFYNRGGDNEGYSGTQDPWMLPLYLSTEERADLVEFLKTLTGDPVPEPLRQDTSLLRP